MKKFLSLLLALTMLFCTACGSKDNKTTDNIFTDITGIAADETVMTVGEIEIPADLFFYWVTTLAQEAESYYAQYYMYTGQYGHILNSDLTLNWNASYMQGISMGDMICSQAMEQLAFFVIVESFAKTHNIEVTDEQRAEIEETITKNIDLYAENLVKKDSSYAELSREEIESRYFYNLGIDKEDVSRMMTITYLRDAIVDQILTEGSPLYAEDAAYDDFAFYADHILIATIDLTSQMPLNADKIAEKTTLAETLLARLQESENMETLFASLADLHSEDTGRASYPTGYIFTSGTMVAEFENAVAELEPGELSGLVKSQFGYHIILRRDLSEGLEAYPEEKAKLAETYMNTMINTILANSSVSTSEALVGITMSEVYTTYMQMIGQRTTSDIEVADK